LNFSHNPVDRVTEFLHIRMLKGINHKFFQFVVDFVYSSQSGGLDSFLNFHPFIGDDVFYLDLGSFGRYSQSFTVRFCF
jgi:hypothetical protein